MKPVKESGNLLYANDLGNNLYTFVLCYRRLNQPRLFDSSISFLQHTAEMHCIVFSIC